MPTSALYHFNGKQDEQLFWGAHAPSRAGDDALVIAHFFPPRGSTVLPYVPSSFRRGAETSTRGACAPQMRASRHDCYTSKGYKPLVGRATGAGVTCSVSFLRV